MFDSLSLYQNLKNATGLEQVVDPDIKKYSDDLVISDSSLIIQERNQLLTDEVIDLCLNDFSRYNYPEYIITNPYAQGAIVKFNDDFYESQIPGNTDTPGSSLNWEERDFKSEKISRLFRQADLELYNKIFQGKKLKGFAKSLIQNVNLFEGLGNIRDKQIKENRMVGFQFQLKPHEGLGLKVQYIGLQFDTNQTGLNIYLFHQSQKDPIKTFQVNTNANQMTWIALPDWILNYYQSERAPGALFELAYYEEDVSGQAIVVNRDFLEPPCNSCDNGSRIRKFQVWNKFTNVQAFRVPQGSYVKGKRPDNQDFQYLTSSNNGINLRFSIHCDITALLLEHKELFYQAQCTNRAIKLLEAVASNLESNDISERAKTMAKIDVEGDKEVVKGLKKELKDEIDAINIEFSGMNSLCLPCENSREIYQTSA